MDCLFPARKIGFGACEAMINGAIVNSAHLCKIYKLKILSVHRTRRGSFVVILVQHEPDGTVAISVISVWQNKSERIPPRQRVSDTPM